MMSSRSARVSASTGSCVTSMRAPREPGRGSRGAGGGCRPGFARRARRAVRRAGATSASVASAARERDTLRLAARQLARPCRRVGLDADVGEQSFARVARAAFERGTPRSRSPNATLSSALSCAEQQIVLEHHADGAVLRRGRRCSGPDRRRRRRRSRSFPRRSGAARPARASSVVLPAPFGPSTASISPSATESSASSTNSPTATSDAGVDASQRRRTSGRAGRRAPTSATASSTRLNTIAASVLPASSVTYTNNGSVCVLPAAFPANVIVAPNSPSARAQHNSAPAIERGPDRRQGHAPEHAANATRPSVRAASS